MESEKDVLDNLVWVQLALSKELKNMDSECETARVTRKRIQLAKEAETALRKYILFVEENEKQ